MPALHSTKNQYLGVNAHLHSYWQGRGGWSRFHTNHLADLLRALRPLLLPRGYDADIEPSLQIRRLDDAEPTRRPESDLTIYDRDHERAALPRGAGPGGGVAELVLPLAEGLFGEALSDKEYGAIAIYETLPDRLDRGEPIAWLELLSPSNKPGGRDARDYFDKRLTVLESGIAFVEIDYLHESPTTLRGLAGYQPRRGGTQPDDDAHAYRIAIIDPRPTFQRGTMRVSDFDVDAPFPIIALPLSGDETLTFDFGVPYRKTFEETLYGLQLVDYTTLPDGFARYSASDQRRIVARMLAVAEAAARGQDLETGPFPVTDLPLEEGLARLAALVE